MPASESLDNHSLSALVEADRVHRDVYIDTYLFFVSTAICHFNYMELHA